MELASGAVRIGVVSDTHDNLPNVARIVERLNSAGVERVVHTGDITRARTLETLGQLEAPLVGVYGNNDVEREALAAAAEATGARLVEPPLHVEWAERRIVVVHDPRDLDPALLDASDVALHGHIHEFVLERRQGALVFNPGECAGMLRGKNAVGVLDLATLEAERLFF